jgi:hypothetical protein
LGEIERGEGCEYTTEYEDRKEGKEHHGQQLAGQDVSEPFNTLKVNQDTINHCKYTCPKKKAYQDEENPHPRPTFKLARKPVPESPYAGFQ